MNKIALIITIIVILVLAWLFISNNTIDEFSNYGPEYSTNNPEYAPWDISSPFYREFWGYDYPYLWNSWNGFGWYPI